jgi:hypothetical protein
MKYVKKWLFYQYIIAAPGRNKKGGKCENKTIFHFI